MVSCCPGLSASGDHMAGVKGLLARIRKLEPQPGFALRKFGGQAGWERFEADCKAGIADGRLDPRDMPEVLYCLRRWVEAGY